MTPTPYDIVIISGPEWNESANTSLGTPHYKNRPPAGWFDMPGSPMRNTAVVRKDVNTGDYWLARLLTSN